MQVTFPKRRLPLSFPVSSYDRAENVPITAVSAIASAPQNVTRAVARKALAPPCLQHTEFVVVLLSGKWRDVETAPSPLVGSAEWAKNLLT
jgi:hypothetical protein